MRLLIALVLLSTACARVTIPYDLSAVPTAKRPVHPLTIAILPLVDGRKTSELPDPDGRFVYRGVEYTGTHLGRLSGDPMWRLTEVVGKHLARTNYFQRVLLVLAPAQAPDADLFLHGRVLRARGYVETNEPPKNSGRPPDERQTLSEVAFESLTITDREGRVLMDVDVGWSTFGKEKLDDERPLDPWVLLASSTRIALSKWAEEVREADLSGAYVVEDKVGMPATTTTTAATLDALSTAAPRGWDFVQTSTAVAPTGWKATASCAAVRFQQRQTIRFHRFLGTYRPSVDVWSCPESVALTYDTRAEFPALYIGSREGQRYFVHRIGKSNWPTAMDEIGTRLDVRAPARRHTFELPALP